MLSCAKWLFLCSAVCVVILQSSGQMKNNSNLNECEIPNEPEYGQHVKPWLPQPPIYVTDYSLILMVRSGHISGKFSYQGIMEAAYGRVGYILLGILQFFYPFIAMVSYNVVVGDTVTKVVIRLTSVSPESIFSKREVIVLICTLAVTIPLCMYRNIAKLANISFTSLVCIGTILLAIFVRIGTMKDIVPSHPDSWNFANYDVIPAIGIMSFAFMCHHNTFLIYGSIQEADEKRWEVVTHISLLTSLIITALFGIAGYATFTAYTREVAGRQVKNATSRTMVSPEGGWITTSNITAIVEPNRKSLVVICHGLNMQLTENVVSTHTINVLYPPSQPFIHGYTKGTHVPAGTLQKISCTSSGGNPLASITWYKNDKKVRLEETKGTLNVESEKIPALTNKLEKTLEELKDTKESNTFLQLQLDDLNKTHHLLKSSYDDVVASSGNLEKRVLEIESILDKYKIELQNVQAQRDKVLQNETNLQKLLDLEKLQTKTLKSQNEKDARCILDLTRQVKEMERIIARKHPDSVSALIVAAKKDQTDNNLSARKLLENRIKNLEEEVTVRDKQSSKVFMEVQEKFTEMKIKYESHIEDLELHVNDLKEQLKRKVDSFDVYTQTIFEDQKQIHLGQYINQIHALKMMYTG